VGTVLPTIDHDRNVLNRTSQRHPRGLSPPVKAQGDGPTDLPDDHLINSLLAAEERSSKAQLGRSAEIRKPAEPPGVPRPEA
jgi:hypothetical protein